MAFAVYDNDPALGYIRWSDLHIQYQGVTYAITDGHTAYRFVWWDPDVSTTDLQVADTLPTLSDDAILVFLNKDGVHVTVPRSTVVDGSLIVSESILADALATNSVVSDKIAAGAIVSSKIGAEEVLGIHILAGEIDTNHIAANAITANKIAANTITSNELAADAVTANELAALNVGVGKYIRSTTYTPGSDGWSIDADGTAEFNDVTVRGEVEASEFRGAPTASILGVNGSFDTDTSGWTAYTAEFPNSQISRVTNPVRSGSGALRIQSSSGAGVRAAYTEVACEGGDIIHAAGWVRKDDVSDNAAETWWDTVSINVDFYDSTNTLVHQYFHESIQANAVEWRLLEVYAAAPLDRDITKARIYFSSYSNAAALGRYALYVDDVTIGIAPMLEVPYMVTHEDGERKRALITPQQFAFESQFSNYPYGLLAYHNAHTPSLRVTGPYGFGNQAPQLELVHDLLMNRREARFGVDVVQVPEGTSSTPGLAVGSSGAGLFVSGTTLGFMAGNTPAAYYTSTGRHRYHQTGTESTPTISTPDNTSTGLGWALAPSVLSISAGGTYVAHFRPTTSTTTVVFPNHATTTGTANVMMAASGNLYRLTSSREIKRDIETLSESVIDRLRPVSYKLKPEHANEDADPEATYIGFIAEEVAEVDERLGQYDENGDVTYFDVNGIVANLVAEVQSLRKRVADLEANVDA